MAEKEIPMFLVAQQGGSSREWYIDTYSTRKHAEAAVKGHAKASYNSVGPLKIPAELAKALDQSSMAEAEFLQLISVVCCEVTGAVL